MSVNKWIGVGNVGKDGVTLRYTASGTAVANFSMATNERFTDRDGNKKEKVSWHKIVVWRQLAEICGKFLVSGSQVYIEGKLEYGSYENKDGVKIPTAEIVVDQMQMLGSKGDDSGQRSQPPSPRRESASRSEYGSVTGGGGGYQEPPFNPDDDIPFLALPECRFDGDALHRNQLFKW